MIRSPVSHIRIVDSGGKTECCKALRGGRAFSTEGVILYLANDQASARWGNSPAISMRYLRDLWILRSNGVREKYGDKTDNIVFSIAPFLSLQRS